MFSETDSTLKNPLAFFDYFFNRNGFQKCRERFFTIYDEGGYPFIDGVQINKEEEYITFTNDEGIVSKIFFKVELKKEYLDPQKLTSLKLIDQQIKLIVTNGNDASPYIQWILDKLQSLVRNIKPDSILSNYDSNLRTLYLIVIELNNNYPSFFTQINSPIIQEAVDFFNLTKSFGFESDLNDIQIEKIFAQLSRGEIKMIDESTDICYFKAIFKKEELPIGFKKIVWIHKNRKNKPNQTTLREFLKAFMKFDTSTPDQETINSCFTDENGENIVLANFKKDEFTEYWTKKFEKMIL